MRSIKLFGFTLLMLLKTVILSIQMIIYPAIRRTRQSIQQMIFRHIDEHLDALFHTVNQFQRYQLYRHPSEVSVEEMRRVKDAFLRLADRNRQGNDMGMRQTVIFLIAFHRARYTHTKAINHMSQALNIHALLRHAFGLR